MGNVSLPTPVALAGAGLCVLGGYLLGLLTGPEAPTPTAGVVQSYDGSTGRLCLRVDDVDDAAEPVDAGAGEGLCGTWLPTRGPGDVPERGDRVRFVSVVVDASDRGSAGDTAGRADVGPVTVIYGEVVG